MSNIGCSLKRLWPLTTHLFRRHLWSHSLSAVNLKVIIEIRVQSHPFEHVMTGLSTRCLVGTLSFQTLGLSKVLKCLCFIYLFD